LRLLCLSDRPLSRTWLTHVQPQRVRDPSVDVGAEWEQLEEIDFSRLSKLRLEVGEPTEM